MKKIRNNGSRIFMTELMFAIFFFIVIAAVCVQCFAASYVKSQKASELTEAVNLASNAAEDFMSGSLSDKTGFTDYYDADWQLCQDQDSSYRVTGIIVGNDETAKVTTLSITVAKMEDDSEIYSLNVERAKEPEGEK